MPVRKLARTVRAAFKDAGDARNAASDARFRANLQKDRRSTLRRFDTVEHALQDRAKAEKTAPRPGPGAKASKKKK